MLRDYDDWGNPIKKAVLKMGLREVNLVKDYTGHTYDPVLGKYYAKARLYDAESRRFMAADPVKGTVTSPISMNPYVYVLDNPLGYTDPSGMRIPDDSSNNGSAIALPYRYEIKDPHAPLKPTVQSQPTQSTVNGENEGTHKPISCEVVVTTGNSIVDQIIARSIELNKTYVYNPWKWEAEFQSNIENLISVIPNNVSDEMRISLVDLIIIMESQKLQRKYETVYNQSGTVISKYVTSRGLYDELNPLYTSYPSYKDTNQYVEAAVDGFLLGANAGIFYSALTSRIGLESGGKATLEISNDILGTPRVGSALKLDKYHAFNDIVDNYAGAAAKTNINNGVLYQLEGVLNGVKGRFEWIIQEGNVTHRMFIPNGTINGVPIRP